MSELRWRKSSHSQQHECVEVACAGVAAKLRDGKLGDESPVLSVSAEVFGAFLRAVKSDRFPG